MTPLIAKRAVRDATVTGFLAFGSSLALTLVYATGAGFGHVDVFNWLELLALALLPLGVMRRSRVAAVALFMLFLADKLYFWIDERTFIGVPIALIMAWFLWRGVRGTFALADQPESVIPATA